MLRMHLPQLQQLDITGLDEPEHTPAGLHLDGNSLQAAAQLERLTLQHPGTSVILQPDCFKRLPALASLELRACSLVSIPPAVAALAGSLTSLALPYNDDMQLAADDIAVLLALRELRQLNLQKSSLRLAFLVRDGDTAVADAVKARLHYEPSLWSPRSLQHLVQLPGTFLAHHGHVPALKVWE